jgi:hypothetical protein
MKMVADVLEDGMQEGVFADTPAPLVAGWILAMIQRTVRFMKAEALSLDEQEAVDRTVDAAHRLAGTTAG